jgi:hypothetical protein
MDKWPKKHRQAGRQYEGLIAFGCAAIILAISLPTYAHFARRAAQLGHPLSASGHVLGAVIALATPLILCAVGWAVFAALEGLYSLFAKLKRRGNDD